MVRPRRLELPLLLKNSDLNAARLPIPPRPHTVFLVFIPCYYFWKDKSFYFTLKIFCKSYLMKEEIVLGKNKRWFNGK